MKTSIGLLFIIFTMITLKTTIAQKKRNPAKQAIGQHLTAERNTDTIVLPNRFHNKNIYPDGLYYKSSNLLISTDISAFSGVNISEIIPSQRIPIITLDTYIRNYKEVANGSSAIYTRQYAFNVDSADIGALTRLADYTGIRIYMGMKDKSHPDTLTLILTAYDNEKSDLYLPNISGIPDAIDKVAPCPYDCPYKQSDATGPRPKKMLGRHTKDPQ